MGSPIRRPLPKWVPLVVLAVSAAYLGLRWDAIPPRWPIHWDAGGIPNGWSEHTTRGVFGPLVTGAGTLALIELLFSYSRRRANRTAAVRPVSVATEHVVRAVSLSIALISAFIAIELPLGPPLPVGVIAAVPILIVVAALAGGAFRILRALSEVREAGHGAEVEGYHAFYYANSNDPRLWVPKLSGFGWTVNFAHPWAWPVMVLIVAVPIAIVVLGAQSAHSR
jgi:uncharacterized membrane protein